MPLNVSRVRTGILRGRVLALTPDLRLEQQGRLVACDLLGSW